MLLIAIDPGTTESAVVVMRACDGGIEQHFKIPNAECLAFLVATSALERHVVIEMIASYGRPVGAEVFETCVWIGRFIEAASESKSSRLYRSDVTKHLCGSSYKTNDAIVKTRLIDIYSNGCGRSVAVGTKKNPGPLYGIKADCWQALALGITFGEKTYGWEIQ